MSHSQFHSMELFILRHAWLNLWDKHMTTGRINQVTLLKWVEACRGHSNQSLPLLTKRRSRNRQNTLLSSHTRKVSKRHYTSYPYLWVYVKFASQPLYDCKGNTSLSQKRSPFIEQPLVCQPLNDFPPDPTCLLCDVKKKKDKNTPPFFQCTRHPWIF